MNDGRRDPRSRPLLEFDSHHRLPADMPLHSKTPSAWRSARPESGPYSSSALLARQRWRDPRNDGNVDFDAPPLLEHPRRPPSPRCERRPPFASAMFRERGGDRRRPYPDDCDELSLESYDYREGPWVGPDRYAVSSDRPRRPLCPTPFDPDRERPFGYEDWPRPSFGPSRPRPEGERFEVPGGVRERPFDPRSPHSGRPRFNREAELEAPPRPPRMHPGDGNRGRPYPPGHRGASPNGGSWPPRPRGFEHPRGIENRADYLPFREDLRESWPPSRRGPSREDFQDTGEECPPRPHFGQRPEDCSNWDQRPPFSGEHQDWDNRQRTAPDYCKQPVPLRDYDHWGSHPRELQEHRQERPDAPYCDNRPANLSGVRGNSFQPTQVEGQSRERSDTADQEPPPGMRDPRRACNPRGVSQNSGHDPHSGSAYEGRQLTDRCGTRPALSNNEQRGDPNHGSAPGRQERPTNFNPDLPNLQESHKEDETAKPVRQEPPHNSESSGWSIRQNNGEAGARNSGVHERAVDAGCLWPNLQKTGNDGPVNADHLRGPNNTESKAQLPVCSREMQAESRGPPATSIPPAQLSSPNHAATAAADPSVSQHPKNTGQNESDSHQRPPVSALRQQQYFPARNLQPSAPTDLKLQRPQNPSFIGNVPQLVPQSRPQNPPSTCLDNVDRPLAVTEGAGSKEGKPSIPIDPRNRKLEPPPSPPWLLDSKELVYKELRSSVQENVTQGDKSWGPQRQMISADRGKKTPLSSVEQHPPQISSKISCGPRQLYGPNYPQDGRQAPVSESQPKAASLPAISSIAEQPSPSPAICSAPRQMTTTSANLVQFDTSVPTPLKCQESRAQTIAYPKVRFSLPSPLLAQGQARFPAPSNQEGIRAIAPHPSISHAKPVTPGDTKQPPVPPAVQSNLGDDQPSAEIRSLEPPPGIPSFFTVSLQGTGTATNVPHSAPNPGNFQGQQATTAVSQKQRSPAPDCQGEAASALPLSKPGGYVGTLEQRSSKLSSDLYGPKVSNPTAGAIQSDNTGAHSGSSEVEKIGTDADDAGISVQINKTGAIVAHSMLQMKKLENQPAPKTANQTDQSKKNESQYQNTSTQNKGTGLKKQLPLIMKRAGKWIKNAAKSKTTEAESEKQATAGNKGPLTNCGPSATDPPKPSNGTGETPSKERGSGLKNAEEDVGNQATSVTKQNSTSPVKKETLGTEESAESNDEILGLDDNEELTIKETSSSSDPVVNDQEVSSSTPECSDEGASVGESNAAGTSKEPSSNSAVTLDGGDNCSEKRKLSTGNASCVTKRDANSDSEQSDCPNPKRAAKSRSPLPKEACASASRAYSSDEGYEYPGTDTRNYGIYQSGRVNEGQIFGIPVVFKAISTTRTFWQIRGTQVSCELEQVVGENVVNQKINRAGFLCVNVATAADAVKLLSIRKLGGADVEAVIPSMYLRHEAKIRGVPYNYTNEELTAYFSDVGVVGARRQVTVKRLHDGSFEEYPRSSVILTFKPDATLPRVLELGHDRFIVEEYIEAPFQCFKCLRFGHTARDCVSVSRCKNCGARYCQEDCARNTPLCANCFGPHPATYVGCPRRREVAFASLWKKAYDLSAL